MSKKRRVHQDASIGAPSADDSPHAQLNNPSSSAASIRVFPPTTIPSLTTLCIRAFASHIVALWPDEQHVREGLHRQLKALPDHLVPRLFSALRQTCPTRLTSAMITAVRNPSPLLSLSHTFSIVVLSEGELYHADQRVAGCVERRDREHRGGGVHPARAGDRVVRPIPRRSLCAPLSLSTIPACACPAVSPPLTLLIWFSRNQGVAPRWDPRRSRQPLRPALFSSPSTSTIPP
jgi:hypothetical protein